MKLVYDGTEVNVSKFTVESWAEEHPNVTQITINGVESLPAYIVDKETDGITYCCLLENSTFGYRIGAIVPVRLDKENKWRFDWTKLDLDESDQLLYSFKDGTIEVFEKGLQIYKRHDRWIIKDGEGGRVSLTIDNVELLNATFNDVLKSLQK